ncbi:hypothetical protein AB0A74_00820 [Saccharothrix sp. NPDC042600]|uniref:hypothetical protein n=1 Tax=Saccharothrix TaxID=2071 RepID=UPI0033DB0945
MGDEISHERFDPKLEEAVAAHGLTPLPPEGGIGDALAEVTRVLRRHLSLAGSMGPVDVGALRADVEQALGATAQDFLADGRVTEVRGGLWDRLQSFYLLGRRRPVNVEGLVDALRAVRLVELLAAGAVPDSARDLRRVARATLVLPDLATDAAVPKPGPSRRDRARREAEARRAVEHEALWTEFVELVDGLRVLREAPVEWVVERHAEPRGTGEEPGTTPAPAGAEWRQSLHGRLPHGVVESLPHAAKQAVATLPASQSMLDKPLFIEAVQHKLAVVADRLLNSTDAALFKVMPEAAAQVPGMAALAAKYKGASALELDDLFEPVVQFPWVVHPVIRPLGIGDLKVVKQTLQRYVAGEVAHIENVLDGEGKDRTHRRLDRTEQTFTIETETVEDTERDAQTTDRFELKKESEKTIRQDMSVNAGVTVSASYGVVELGAYADFAYSQSSAETTKNSQNFARDVVDRSLTKIQKRVREERVTKTIREIEESNLHKIDNTPAGNGHVTGIYRWVDKHYQAQVHNYGVRMMFEFIIPEPAEYYHFAQEHDPAKNAGSAEPPTLDLLSHKDVQSWNFGDFVKKYNVQGVVPPPPEWKVVTTTFAESGMADDQYASKTSKEVVVPDGYLARGWGAKLHGFGGTMVLTIGTHDLDTPGLDGEDSMVPISLITSDTRAFAVNVEVWCERTARAFEVWQIQTFEKIVAAYEAAKAAHEDKVKAATAARGVVVEGRNPGANLRIVRNELKKQAITLLTGQDYSSFDSVSGLPPVTDLAEAAEEGRFIQFFEQAFEWEQATHLFYPYFWARPSTWGRRLAAEDPDPHFTQFLQAGGARVVVPVRPAYNEAILHYVETGELWHGGDPPHIDDPLFVSLVEELKAQTDDLENAVPQGDPWPVVVPTTLVHLQADAVLPDFTQ